jgi:DnaJ-class molecular chaperone
MMAMAAGMLLGMWGGIFIFLMPNNKSKQNNNTSASTTTGYSSNSNSSERKENTPVQKRGANLKYNMALNSTEATYGTTKTINIKKDELCRTCNGRGIINMTLCNKCGGLGKRCVLKPLAVTIPAGVETGKMLIVKGEGDPGMFGGSSGDLYIEILVR